MTEIPKAYEPQAVEEQWYDFWVKQGCFTADPARVSARRPAYAIVIPPPNVTGMLHMGHVLNNTIQDILSRKARMDGREVLWLPGTDHAGIATQVQVEKALKKEERKTKHDLGREEFLKRVWAWKEKHGGIIITQLKKLGCSCDWTRERFTMDPEYSRGVQKVFVELYRKGLIYRGKRMVNWCPVSQTALSDEEVEMKPQKGFLYHFRVEVAESLPAGSPGNEAPATQSEIRNPKSEIAQSLLRSAAPEEKQGGPEIDSEGRVWLTIATTRPETIPGDTAVAVNPKDPRYAHLIGKHIIRPLPIQLPAERKLIPIIGDEHVDFEFGTGVLKVTPAHDKADFEIGQRHQLPIVDIMNANGTMNDLAGESMAGLDRFEARDVAVERLKELGALVEEKPYENNVGFSQRADVPIEPRLSEQWFLQYPSVDASKRCVAEGRMRFHPDRWAKVYDHWLANLQDWCISRQLWWGHRIPVWYRKSEGNTADVYCDITPPPDPGNWEQDPDVLDTWFSSWLWPFATLGWTGDPSQDSKIPTLQAFYPTTDLVTGPDIIFFWVARMIMAGYEFMGDLPFKNVYFTGIIRDKQGRKMSKTLGNSPDPLDLIGKYGADALRFGTMRSAPLGQDVLFDEKDELLQQALERLPLPPDAGGRDPRRDPARTPERGRQMDPAQAQPGHPGDHGGARIVQLLHRHPGHLPLLLERVLRLVCRGQQGGARQRGRRNGEPRTPGQHPGRDRLCPQPSAAPLPSLPAVCHGGTLARHGLQRGYAGRSGRADHHERPLAQTLRTSPARQLGPG